MSPAGQWSRYLPDAFVVDRRYAPLSRLPRLEPIHLEPIHLEPIHLEPIHLEPIHRTLPSPAVNGK
jgi:hypothetical protein